jgi:hypothetical protein
VSLGAVVDILRKPVEAYDGSTGKGDSESHRLSLYRPANEKI